MNEEDCDREVQIGMIEDEENVCEFCGGTGIITEGQFDDIRERKCICQISDNDEDDDS